MTRPYQICVRCVMDTTDPDIQFDENGVCNHCHEYDLRVKKKIFTGEVGQRKLELIVNDIKRAGAKKDYDCVIGVSGGVDSTYLAYKVKQMGLRPLAVHLDNGWDSELAVKNIEQVLKKLNIDLHTLVLDWEEFKDLQLAFLKASTPDSEIPSDHAIFALMYHTAEKIGVNYILLGNNTRTETHLPSAWSQGHLDWKYIKSIHQQLGTIPLKTFPYLNLWTYFRYRATQKWIYVLDYLDYVKQDAMDIIQRELNWKYYGGKHYESIYTRFYQGYILPRKFGYDKRKSHLSSLICSGEITREDALAELEQPTYSPALQKEDREYVVKKFGLTDEEFEKIMNLPKKSYGDYPSYNSQFFQTSLYQGLLAAYRLLTKVR